MPSLPDIPGKSLVSGGGRRAGKLAAGSALAMIAVGGYVLRRIVRRGDGGEDAGPDADPIAQTPTAPPGAENGADPVAEKPPVPSAPTAEAPTTAGTDAPPKPEAEPGDRSGDEEPPRALSSPAEDPDPTEWPDPYDKRSDPLGPPDPDRAESGEVAHTPPGAESTSQPHPSQDLEAGERATPPEREKLDD